MTTPRRREPAEEARESAPDPAELAGGRRSGRGDAAKNLSPGRNRKLRRPSHSVRPRRAERRPATNSANLRRRRPSANVASVDIFQIRWKQRRRECRAFRPILLQHQKFLLSALMFILCLPYRDDQRYRMRVQFRLWYERL
jgi:hypothetical protein